MPIDIDEIYNIINQEAHENGSLISALEAIQTRYRFLPREAIYIASERLGVPLSQAFAVATFYNAFSLQPKGKHCLQVCTGTACHVRGSLRVLDQIKTQLRIEAGETTPDHLFTLETVNCLGACALGPIVVSDGEYSGQMTPGKADLALKRLRRLESE